MAKDKSAEIDGYISGIANGGEGSLEALYEITQGAVYGYALSVTKNVYDAQDVLHDTFVKVYEKSATYVSQGKPMAWILTIAKNICMSRFRQNSRFCDIPDEELEAQFADNSAMSVEDKLLVTKCLSQLSYEERTVVVLHAMSGLKHREIAKLLDMPLATVLSKYNRAIKKLKTIAEGELE